MVAEDTITDQLQVVGRLVPIPGGSALLSTPAAGIVKAVHVQVGASVMPGQLLVELDVPELAATARQLTSAAEVAERDAKRQQDLLAQGITSRREADEKAAGATSARSAADAAVKLLARAEVRSPLRGGVQRVIARAGERVDAGAPLVEVIDGRTLDLVAAVPGADLGRLKREQSAVVRDETAGASLTGHVVAIAPGVDSITNAGQVVIRVPNSEGRMHAGGGATAILRIGQRSHALLVPDSAIVVVGDSLAVFVIGVDSVAHARTVSVGVRHGGRSEVHGSLKPGDRVVTTGAYGLTDGMRVVPTNSDQPKE